MNDQPPRDQDVTTGSFRPLPPARGREEARAETTWRSTAPPAPSARILEALADELPTLYRLVGFLSEGDLDADETVEWLGTLALSPTRSVPPGRERAYVLRALLALVGADSSDRRHRAAPLPDLAGSSPMPNRSVGIGFDDLGRLDIGLRALDRATRASVLLVLHEGLTIDEASRIQGGSRRAFARRYASGVASLDGELIDMLIGRSVRASQS